MGTHKPPRVQPSTSGGYSRRQYQRYPSVTGRLLIVGSKPLRFQPLPSGGQSRRNYRRYPSVAGRLPIATKASTVHPSPSDGKSGRKYPRYSALACLRNQSHHVSKPLMFPRITSLSTLSEYGLNRANRAERYNGEAGSR